MKLTAPLPPQHCLADAAADGEDSGVVRKPRRSRKRVMIDSSDEADAPSPSPALPQRQSKKTSRHGRKQARKRKGENGMKKTKGSCKSKAAKQRDLAALGRAARSQQKQPLEVEDSTADDDWDADWCPSDDCESGEDFSCLDENYMDSFTVNEDAFGVLMRSAQTQSQSSDHTTRYTGDSARTVRRHRADAREFRQRGFPSIGRFFSSSAGITPGQTVLLFLFNIY